MSSLGAASGDPGPDLEPPRVQIPYSRPPSRLAGPSGDHVPEPEKVPLVFEVDKDSLAPEAAEVVGSIKQLAESLLFHWKHFPIVLPDSITERRAAEASGSGTEYSGAVQFKDLFVAPTFDELEAVATGEDGALRKLNKEQLVMVQRHGEFDVASLNFPGQTHRWRLSMMLQKGKERTSDSFYSDLSKALSLLIITARDRLYSQVFSVTEAARGWASGARNLLDILIGMPSTSPGNIASKLHEERMRYLVAELDIKPNLKPELSTFCQYIKLQCMGEANKYKTSEMRPPPIPYRYQTPKGQEIDLRLFNKDLMNNSLGILSNILDRQAKGWHVQMRAKLIRHYQGQDLSNEAISKNVSEDLMTHYLDKVFTVVADNEELEGLQPGLGQLLVDQAKAILVMLKAQGALQVKMDLHKEQLTQHLKKTYPIKSLISTWMKEQLRAFEEDFARQHLWAAHEAAIGLCEEGGLHQSVYFLRRDLNFIKERETVMMKELSRIKTPTRIFTFATRIWMPKNWVKTESQYQNGYSKNIVRKTSTRFPFWRWWNFFNRVWAWTWNAIFVFGIAIPIASPISYRALVWPTTFVPDTHVTDDGILSPMESSRTQSLVSRLRALWKHVRLSRSKFEATPDRGFLGKSLTRHFNRVWNYVFKGAIGSALVVIVMPVVCVTVSTVSMLAAVMCPLWVPVFALLAHVFGFLVYDFDVPDPGINKLFILFESLVWNMLIQGCVQPVVAAIVALVACPIGALFICLFTLCRSGVRQTWDTLMFHLIIKSRGRIPASDSFVARRISGPGLASNYFYQIRPEQALAAVEAMIERDELEAWRSQVTGVIERPREAYRRFIDNCFKPFSGSMEERGVYAALCQETRGYLSDLSVKAESREAALFTGLNYDLQRRIKLAEADLKLTIVYTAALLEEFYPHHVISRLDDTEEAFWERRELEYRDWRGFAAKKLKDIFSPTFLTPLEETDNCFQLKVNHMNIERYGDMLASAEFHDDLDLVVELHTPEGDINVTAPNLDVGNFDPNRKQVIGSTRIPTLWTERWSRRTQQSKLDINKMDVPLSIPHPAYIAVAIYNREHDQEPLDLSEASVQRVVRATKELQMTDVVVQKPKTTGTPNNSMKIRKMKKL